MRKIYALLLAIVATVALQAQTQDNAMYVYRNDGGFNAFLREDIDSITLSHFDLDSIQHKEPVCQVFHTPDSIYRIPIEAIDSVSFVQPETKYASGVILLDEQYLPYIVDVTENTITFSSSTPSELLPKKGNVLAAMVFDEALSEGFAGRIDSETITDKGIRFECSDVSIEDIYDQFVYTGKTIAADETAMAKAQKVKRRSSGLKTFNIETIHASSGPVNVEAHPTITVFYTINRNKNLKTHQSLIAIADIDVDVSLEAKVEVGEKPHIMWLPGTIRIPTQVPGLYGFIRGGAFYKTTAAASVTATCPGHIYWKFGFTNGDDGFNPIWNYNSNIQRPEFSVNMNGELDAGLCARIGFNIMSDKVASIYLTGYAGLYAKADFSLTDAGLLDGTLYSSLKDSQLEAGAYLCGEPGYTVMEQEFTWRKEEEKDINLSWEHRFPFRTWYLLPDFSEPKVNRSANQTSAVVQSTASRDLIMPVQLGLSVENDYGEVVDTKWCDGEYRLEKDWPSNALWKQFDNLKSGNTYTAYPYVRILGYEMKASPSKEFKFEGQQVDITDFKVISSQHQQNGFTYNGSTYSYKFNTSVTLTLKDSEGVEDWGYVYKDLQGKYALISLKTFGTTYTDTRYAYYRNSAESTVTLFGYVKYQGDNEYYLDEPQTFQLKHKEGEACVDANHVHKVDLGLSVKWACCNVGASSPEQYGGYYAWGETNEKSDYSPSTYQYWVDKNGDGYFDWDEGIITTDIAGTQYDVAHVRWGGSWRMPTWAEIQELVYYCSWQWTAVNGVYGHKVTGPNGNSIFLPAAGSRYGTSNSKTNDRGCYWTSKPEDDNSRLAYGVGFNSGGRGWISTTQRLYGFSVRPVSE